MADNVKHEDLIDELLESEYERKQKQSAQNQSQQQQQREQQQQVPMTETKATAVPMQTTTATTAANTSSTQQQQQSSSSGLFGNLNLFGTRNVLVNGVKLTEQQISQLQWFVGPLLDGNYWYDNKCGAWGKTGGPSLGILSPGLNLGGDMKPDCSGGNTGVFVNGRQLHYQDCVALTVATGSPCIPGRYWVDALGNCGLEGSSIPMFNIKLLAAAKASSSSSGSGGPWSWHSKSGDSHVGGDGQGSNYASFKNSDGSYTSWSSGM
jgi:hypothetical protein